MAFAKTPVTDADRAAFDLSKIVTPWGSPLPVGVLTMDRTQGAYLARVHIDREPPHDHSYLFWWQGKRAHLRINLTEEQAPAPDGLIAVVKELRLLDGLDAQRDTVLRMIKEALAANESVSRPVQVWLRLDKNTLI